MTFNLHPELSSYLAQEKFNLDATVTQKVFQRGTSQMLQKDFETAFVALDQVSL